MVNKELRETIEEVAENLGEEIKILDNPSYDNSIIGLYNSRIIYDKELMIKEFATENDCSEEEALEFIEVNTERALPYFDNSPIIMEHLPY